MLQRNQLETAALSVATMRGASWSAIRLLLKPSSGIELSSLAATACLTGEELLRPKQGARRGGGGGASSEEHASSSEAHSSSDALGWKPGSGRPRPLNYWDVAARLRSLELGILIGWRRTDDSHDALRPCGTPGQVLTLNPTNKEAKLLWGPTDQLIIMRRTDGEEHRIEA